jgi:flagellin
MTVNSLSSLAAGIQRDLSTRNERVASSVSALVTGNRFTQASTDVSSLSVAVNLQNQVSSLRAAALNISQASSLLQVADGGAQQISGALDRLAELATQANSGTLSDANRQALNTEFQTVLGELEHIADNTNFNGQALLNGAFDPEAAGLAFAVGTTDNPDFTFDLQTLNADALLGETAGDINLLSQDAAALAFDAISVAQDQAIAARADIGSFQEALGFAVGTVESAIQNQEAARSTLADADFVGLSTARAQDLVGQQASISLLAQANRLPANILQLIGE